MQRTKQDLAIAAAQQVADAMRQLAAIHDAVNAFMSNYATNAYDTTWMAMPTVAFNADGSVGTQDGTPNTAHPINVPTPSPLLIARNDLLTSIGCLQNFQLYMTGAAVTAQPNTPRKYADLLNK